jgi:hypothetical protein
MGGTRTGVVAFCAEALAGGLYDTGGRWVEARLSSGGLEWESDLSRRSSLWPWESLESLESLGERVSGVVAALE